MAATPLCEAPLAALKKSLRDEFPDVKSSHLSEALAFALGFRTYAALNASMVGPEQDRPFALLNDKLMRARLVEFGYADDPEFDFELLPLPKLQGVVSTVPNSAHEIAYKSDRRMAWRNMMVCAVNAALDQKLFTLRPGDNRFLGGQYDERMYEFVLPNGLPAKGVVSDAGFDEVAIYAAVNPKGPYVSTQIGFGCGDAVGMTWVERERGAWMQTSDTSFKCRRNLIRGLAALIIEPKGFGDRGRVIM